MRGKLTAVPSLFLDTLRKEHTDIPPIWLMRQAGRYLPEYRALRAQAKDFVDFCFSPRLAAEATLQPIRRYDFDAAILFADILLIPYAMGQDLTFPEGEGPRLPALMDGFDGVFNDMASTIDVLEPVFETVARVKQDLPESKALIGFAGAPWTVATYMIRGRGGENHADVREWAYRHPERFEALLDDLVAATSAYLSRQIEAGADAIQLFDTWAGGLPEKAFERWCIQPVRQIADTLRKKHPSTPIIGFPKSVGSLALNYVESTSVDGLGLDFGVPLEWARDVLAPHAVLQGNLDPVVLAVGGDRLTAEIDHILHTLEGMPYIFNLGHGILPHTPPEHVELLIDRVRGGPR